jgi:arginyl-tRNA synthetase
VVAELERSGVTVIDDGALCVFVEGFAAPMIVRKSDGGFGYSATDLAAIRHRVRDLDADRIIYVVDARQSDHFDLVFAVARKAGLLPDEVRTEHVAFGTVLGTDGKPFKTRDGTAVTLNTLLDAAEEQAAPPVALAAIKYADLSTGLNKDYVFDVGRMVQTTGNTGPYLQYAHARVTQVLRKGSARGYGEQSKVLVLEEPAEQTLALLLTRFGDVVDEVGRTLQPHRLCAYLYDLSGALAIFYEQCPVLQSSGPVRDSRLALCSATKRVLASGLTMLGIEPLERM